MTHALRWGWTTGYQVTTTDFTSSEKFPISKIKIGLDLQELALKFYFSLSLFSLSVMETGNKKSPTQKL